MTSHAKPAAGMHLFHLDDAGVLFSESQQELHLLNTAAALIWGLIEEGHDEASASAALADLCGLDTSRAAQFVAEATAQWRLSRLLPGLLPSEPAPTIAPFTAPVEQPAATWRETQAVEVRRYCVLESHFEIRFESSAQFTSVHPVLAHLEERTLSEAVTIVDIVESPLGVLVFRDREVFDQAPTLAGLAPIVKSLLWTHAVDRYHFFLDIHAGVVGGDTGCIVLPGSAGSGKSTLTALLAHAGYEFFSDEIALLSEGTFEVVPVPLAICVKESGIAALAGTFPQLRQLPLHLRGDGKRVAYLSPPPEAKPAEQTPRPVVALLFPRFESRAPASLDPIPKAVALKRLLEECVVVRNPLDRDRVAALVKWISRMPCYSLVFSSGSEAVDEIHSILPPKRRA